MASPTLVFPPTESFSSKKGEISRCRTCNNADLPSQMRIHCKNCLTNGYVAKCMDCSGTGMVHAIAAWDAKSKHGSTCNTCGGAGTIPARVSEFQAQQDLQVAAIVEGKKTEKLPDSPTPTPPSELAATGAVATPTTPSLASTT